MSPENIDHNTVNSFGEEWSQYKQSSLDKKEAYSRFHEYFSVFPFELLPPKAEGFDMGCGSGRWSKLMAPLVGKLHCIDPSPDALSVAKVNLSETTNVVFHNASVSDRCLPCDSQDFGYSLGVLHHVPDTQEGIIECARLLKPGAPLLLYLYYDFENRSNWFVFCWKISDLFRRFVFRLPSSLKVIASEIIVLGYFPLARLSLLLSNFGLDVSSIPLSYYKKYSYYSMRTDARDRFGTPLEHRFSKNDIVLMCERAGLENIKFSPNAPYWCLSCTKAIDGPQSQ